MKFCSNFHTKRGIKVKCTILYKFLISNELGLLSRTTLLMQRKDFLSYNCGRKMGVEKKMERGSSKFKLKSHMTFQNAFDWSDEDMMVIIRC